MSKEITTIDPSTAAIEALHARDQLTKELCKAMGITETKKIMEARVKVEWGRALGIHEALALKYIHIFQGQPIIGYSLQGAAVKRDPNWDYKITELTREKAVVQFYEDGEPLPVASEYTIDDAKAQGIYNRNPNWKATPRSMLIARALTNGIRWFCPHLMNGAAALDEYEKEAIQTPAIEVLPPAIEVRPIADNAQAADEAEGAREYAQEIDATWVEEPPVEEPQKTTSKRVYHCTKNQAIEIKALAAAKWGEDFWGDLGEYLAANGIDNVTGEDSLRKILKADAAMVIGGLKG